MSSSRSASRAWAASTSSTRNSTLFGFLLGYGLVQVTRRYAGPGRDPAGARRLIRRRGFWLIVFGVVHVVLLYSGDVIGSYGVLSLLSAGAVAWSGRPACRRTPAGLGRPNGRGRRGLRTT